MRNRATFPGNMNNIMRTFIAIVVLIMLNPSWAHEDTMYKGMYVWGAEVDAFKPCNSETAYWASYNWVGYELVDFYKKETTKPYQEIYVEFRGIMLNEELDGAAEGWKGPIHILEVFVKQLEIPVGCE